MTNHDNMIKLDAKISFYYSHKELKRLAINSKKSGMPFDKFVLMLFWAMGENKEFISLSDSVIVEKMEAILYNQIKLTRNFFNK